MRSPQTKLDPNTQKTVATIWSGVSRMVEEAVEYFVDARLLEEEEPPNQFNNLIIHTCRRPN